MGLSTFPSSSEGLLPMLAVTVAYVVSFLKSLLPNHHSSDGPRQDDFEFLPPPPSSSGGNNNQGGRIFVTRFKWLCRQSGRRLGTTADERLMVECCVCLNRFKWEEEVSELVSCKHFFHKWCLQRWFDNCHNRTTPCPLCRSLR